jgi:hypothetical protein
MRTETKLDYTWIDEAMTAEKCIELEGDEVKVATLMHISLQELRKRIRSLQEVRIYLNKFLGKPEEYSAVQNKKQLFVDLAKITAKTSDTTKQEFQRRALWANDDLNEKLPGRVFAYNWAAESESDLSAWVGALQDSIPKPSNVVEKTGTENSDDNLEFEIIENETVFDESKYLIEQFDNAGLREQTLDIYSRVIESLKEKKDSSRLASAPLDAARKALSQLHGVQVGAAKPETLSELVAQLEQIRDHAKTLIKALRK